MRRALARAGAATTALAGAALLVPATASAHGVQGRAETPIPIEAFFLVAAIVLVVSFIGLAVGWSSPRLEGTRLRRAPRPVEAAALSPVTIWTLRILVLAGFLLVGAAAAFGSTRLGSNLAPLVVFVVWWIGLVPLSVLFGNVWREINPWSTIACLARMPERRPERRVPGWVGVWPAAAVLLAFGWFELVYPTPAEPRLLAILIAVYTVATLAGMWRFGHQVWVDHGEAFSVYTRLLALLSPVEVREEEGPRRLYLRPPFLSVTRMRAQPGIVGVVAVLVATVTYDGLSATGFWARRDVAASERLIDLGLTDFHAGVIIGSFGLLGSLAVFAIGYELCAVAAGRLAHWRHTSVGRVGVAFAHSLVPIAFAYFVAHYFTLFVFQSQDLVRLASDPFGTGADIFGTADARIDFQLVSAEAIWAVQVVAIVVGHVLGLAFAHDRALQLGRTHREALTSQGPFLVLMVALTVAGLWSLSAGMGV